MLSRLAKGVNTVLQELSRDSDEIGDEDTPKDEAERDHQVSKEISEESPKEVLERLTQTEQLVVQLKELIREKDAQLRQKESALKAQEPQVSMETSVKGSEEVLERLAQTEQLVVQLKELIREKDAQLHQKEAALKEEKELADVKMSKLKLQAKAKVASLNKQLEELRKRTAATSPSKQLSEESELDSTHECTENKLTEEQGEELKKLKVHLRDLEEASRVQAEVVSSLQQQLLQAQEQLKDHAKEEDHRLSEEKMQELEKLKSQLQEQEEASRVWEEKVESLQQELQQTREQLEESMRQQQEKLQSLQTVIQEKDLRFQEQLQRHEEELLQVATATDSSAELQQTLKSQQRKLEELEEALHGRTLVVEMLQQELNSADQQKQVLREQLHQTETEVVTLKASLEQEKEVMKGLLEKQELLVRDKDLALVRLEETVDSLTQQLQEAKTAYSDLTEKHMAEITDLQTRLSELRANCDTLSVQNQELKTLVEEEAVQRNELLQKVAQLQDDVNVRAEKNTELESLLDRLKEDSDARVQQLMEQLKSLQEQDITVLQNRVVELEDEKGSLLLSTVDLEELKAENESLRARLATLEMQSEQKTSQVDDSGTSTESQEHIQLEVAPPSEYKPEDVTENSSESIFIQVVSVDLSSSEAVCSSLPLTQSSSDVSEQATPPVQPSTDVSEPPPLPYLPSSTTSEQASPSDQTASDASEQAPPPAESSTDVSEQATTTSQPSAAESDVLLSELSCTVASEQPTVAAESSMDVVEQEHQPSPSTVHAELIEERKAPSQESSPFPQDESTVLVLKEMIAEKDKEIAELMEKFLGAKEELAKLREEMESRTSRQEPEAQIVTWRQQNELQNVTEQKDLITVQSDSQIMTGNLSKPVQEIVNVIQPEESKKYGTQVQHTSTTFTANKCTVWEEIIAEHKEQTLEMSDMHSLSSIHKEEVMRLQDSIMDLNEKLQEMETSYNNALDEKDSEICKLNLEHRKQVDDLNEAFQALTNEKEKLSSQVQQQGDELSHMQELRGKLQATEDSLADAERQRLSDYESRGLQNCLLEEQVESLQNELRSKDLKIETLQRDMDHIQLQLSEEERAVQSLKKQLREKEQMTENLEKSLVMSKSSAEELSLVLASKEDDILRKEQLLFERSQDIEHLHRTLTEKEQEMSEITLSMSDKIVLLSEEKYSQEREMKSLKEQLNLLHKTEEENDSSDKARSASFELQHPLTEGEMLEMGTEDKENVHSQLEHLKRQNEQVKRKLHAALINRKELLKKVEELQMELTSRESREMPCKESSSSVIADYSENALTVTPDERQEVIKSLTAHLSEKDQELQIMKQDVEEKTVIIEQLKNSVFELTQAVKNKENQAEDVKMKAVGQQTVFQGQTLVNQWETQSEGEDSFREVAESDLTSKVLMDQKSSETELKLSSLEQEKEILQKKLQEALASRKETIKKSQEKDRHHREQLKQQKDEYSDLLEMLEARNKEKEELQQNLKELQAQLLPIAGLQSEERTTNLISIKEDLPIVEHQMLPHLKESGWGQEWVDISDSDLKEGPPVNTESPSVDWFRKELEKVQFQKDELQLKLQNAEVIFAEKTNEFIQLQDKLCNLLQKLGLQEIEDLVTEIESIRKKLEEAEACAEGLKLALAESEAKTSNSEELFNLKKDAENLRNVISQKNEETEHLDSKLKEQSEAVVKLQTTLLEKEDLVNMLQTQLENQHKEHEEHQKRQQDKMHESLQKQGEDAEEDAKSKQQLQRKLQAALISRKDALKENKALKEDLSTSNTKLEELTKKIAVTEKAVIDMRKEKEDLLEEMNTFKNEKEKLVFEMDRSLLENHNLSSTCESLKLAIEGVTQEKHSLENEIESLKRVHDALHVEWQDKHKDMQKEYETLLQSYENVSNEMERMQRVLETIRLEKQELLGKIKHLESEKRDTEKQVQEAQQEIEGMKEKMRKFAKSKQQKILELEEENERLRAELNPEASSQRSTIELPSFETAQLREELTKLKSERQSLINELESTKAANTILDQEINILKEKLHLVEAELQDHLEKPEKVSSSEISAEEIVVQHIVPVSASAKLSEEGTDHSTRENKSEEEEEKHLDSGLKGNIDSYMQQIAQLAEMLQDVEKAKITLQGEIKSLNADIQSLKNEKAALESEVTHTGEELKALHKLLEETDKSRQADKEEMEKIKQLRNSIEKEKDDLEERLMNQLAELNGSIANYQQTVSNLQTKISQLELDLENRQTKMGEIEEEKRQLLRQKAEDESKLQKEYEEKLKSAHKGKEGSKTHAKELQELLKEKQEEVRQLQKDCIRYQEKMTDLDKMVKALEFVNSDCRKEVEVAKKNWMSATEENKKKQSELISCRILLDDTQSEVARVQAENLKIKEELQAYKQQTKIQLTKKEEEFEQKIKVEKDRCSKEIENVEEKMEMLKWEKEHSEQTILELRETSEQKKQEFKQLQEKLNENLAKLAAFTRSMSSLQDDRDRVIDETKKWEKKFQDTINMKEEEVRTKEEMCSFLKDQLRQTSIYSEELQIRVSRLEHNEQEWASKLQMAAQNHRELYESLQEENKELQVQLRNSQKLYGDAQTELAKLNNEVKHLSDQVSDLSRLLDQSEKVREENEKTVSEQEKEVQNYKLNCRQLESDVQSCKKLIDTLQEELTTKDQKIISLLAAKEEAVSLTVAEMQQQKAEELKELEDRISAVVEEKDKEKREVTTLHEKLASVEEKLKSAKEESNQNKAKLDSFVKSMSSLQDDRDRVMSEYRQLEERHLAVILEKDSIIQESATENNRVKEELRILHGQMDDLNSLNANLKAQLIRYREDLNQVITLKDSQQKELLKVQLEKIHSLENRKSSLEVQLDDLKLEMQTSNEEKLQLQKEIQSLESTSCLLKPEIEKLQENEAVLKKQLEGREAEVKELSDQLSALNSMVTELEQKIDLIQEEASKKVKAADDRVEQKLKALQHDAGIMRNETETAEERVAELAKDLVESEQRLYAISEENNNLKAQIKSFGNAMSSLQDSRDEAELKLQEVEKKYSAELDKERSAAANMHKELCQLKEDYRIALEQKDSLSSELKTVKTSSTEDSMLLQIERLGKEMSLRDEKINTLTSQLEGSSVQLKSFSNAMGSLQDERDRLIEELSKVKKAQEVSLESGTTSATPSEVQSLKNALSSLQNDRDRLLKELQTLQAEYLRGRDDLAELPLLKSQLETIQQQLKEQHSKEEVLQQEHLAFQEELLTLRSEKQGWALQNEQLKEQYLIALSDKDLQLNDLQRLVQEMRLSSAKLNITDEQYQRESSPETAALIPFQNGDIQKLKAECTNLKKQLEDCLKELHQKELRVHQLNGKLSQVFEEKNALSIQLRRSGQNLRDTQLRYTELQSRCSALEAEAQKLHGAITQKEGTTEVDTAPGAPQEKIVAETELYQSEVQQLQHRLSEAKEQQNVTQQEIFHLSELLNEERELRLAAEEALDTAQGELQRYEVNKWVPVQEHSADVSTVHEHSLLIEPPDSVPSSPRARGSSRLKRLMRYLFFSRTRTPLLVATYLLTVHVLLILCFTGQL